MSWEDPPSVPPAFTSGWHRFCSARYAALISDCGDDGSTPRSEYRSKSVAHDDPRPPPPVELDDEPPVLVEAAWHLWWWREDGLEPKHGLGLARETAVLRRSAGMALLCSALLDILDHRG
jgi:hypothetical protein